MTNLTSVLTQLEQERTRLTSQLENLSLALTALNGRGSKRGGRTVSAAGRARIAAAQRARWAKLDKKVVSIPSRKGRTMSPSTEVAMGEMEEAAEGGVSRSVGQSSSDLHV